MKDAHVSQPKPTAASTKPGAGFTLLELLMGMVISAVIMAGAYSLFVSQSRQELDQKRKIELRNAMTLSSKRIQHAVTMAGLGLKGAANLRKDDAVGSDTLTLFSNPSEAKSALLYDISHSQTSIQVTTGSLFVQGGYVAILTGTGGEIRRIVRAEGSSLFLDSALASDYSKANAFACPANRERYFTDQSSNVLIHEINGQPASVAANIHNFQVSFRNNRGEATEAPSEIRMVNFSFTGIFPAKEGALNSILLSSTAIPRNIL